MAAKPQPPGKKPLSEPENKAQKRALELLTEDCKRICTTNINKPFATLQDAVDHLLPFHVLSAMAGDDADLEEAEEVEAEGGRLLCSRKELATELATRRAVELGTKVDELRGRIGRLEGRYRERGKRPLPEEELFIAQVVKEVAERALEAEKAKPPNAPVSDDEEEV
ncbi:hypothetical protein HYH03_008006 [Edaphochlamys debaryana]|uniref:GLTSCR protein conserved domain-containing protein n=1 Tax=Edaphochlamys debaryana TaxID=47281 RepID=A0A835Y0T1_9CHLO|nr:hypothetical protein HYH03_008006 [Edaphochlamys debaryana]|eukprot:KAG2493786.1 hypothetical protein HYH03_008006 [Edaphochlamys debaryana]